MGMAASQARYLALVARKSNCEYEGQQINQARLILSNQSANLFNQMLGLTVPVPPSTQDFTKIQYSYSDGNNTSVIDSWKQLSNDPEYNYVVQSHYNTNIYTGSVKKMVDPQVQSSNSNSSTSLGNWDQIEAAFNALNAAQAVRDSSYKTWQNTKMEQEKIIENLRKEAKADNSYQVFQQGLNERTNVVHDTGFDEYVFRNITGNPAGDTYNYTIRNFIDPDNNTTQISDMQSVLKAVKDQIELGIVSLSSVNENILNYNTAHGITPTIYIDDLNALVDFSNVPPYSDIQKEVLNAYSLSIEDLNGTATGNTNIVPTLEVESLNSTIPTTAGTVTYSFAGYPLEFDPNNTDATTNADYLTQIAAAQALIDADYNTYEAAQEIYDGAKAVYDALNRPTYIGNSELTLLGTLTEDQATELLQVYKDLKAQGIDSHFYDCFADDGTYLGGIYTFKLNGNTYYTTFQDLDDAYASNHLSNNYIDAQYKMPYYNATYVNTRIDQESKALLETDEEGRFATVRFENDSVVYSLKTETITDDEAYQDAMNQYYYENAIYDKTVQDINAQTSLIHQEDQQLELRLKQLDTEQNALKTEMEAVQKIVKDNVESSFKTFNG